MAVSRFEIRYQNQIKSFDLRKTDLHSLNYERVRKKVEKLYDAEIPYKFPFVLLYKNETNQTVEKLSDQLLQSLITENPDEISFTLSDLITFKERIQIVKEKFIKLHPEIDDKKRPKFDSFTSVELKVYERGLVTEEAELHSDDDETPYQVTKKARLQTAADSAGKNILQLKGKIQKLTIKNNKN